YYLAVWTRYGKDLRPGQIIPLFYPPEGVTPAMASYVYNQKMRDDTFTATLIDLAVRGYLRIEENDVPKGLFSRAKNRFLLHPTDKDSGKLKVAEKAFLKSLFPGGRSLAVEKGSHEELASAKGAIKDLISSRGKDFFIRNLAWVISGILLTILLIGGTGSFIGTYGGEAGASAFMMLWLSVWTLGVGTIVYRGLASLKEGVKRRKAGLFIRGLFLSVFSVPFLGAELFGIGILMETASLSFALSLVGALLINVLFYHLMKNYTPRGRELMDDLEGLRMYMMTAEKERIRALARVDMPEQTPEHFESILPYAIALGVEKEWASSFDDVLKNAQYDPGWYTGTSPWYHMGAASFMTGLSGGLGTAIASSSVAPGSGSGFGGGGFSGGGGGGGGGGGW
ncbi:MAG: DUF2207 domain-containing protein, partial [Thermovirgaceae bacterium]|nr:DUF2207 domain-containing protein [Thermovirgaceae bacterium]